MAEAGFLEAKRVRPGTAVAVILLHGTAITALLMAKGYVPTPPVFTATRVTSVRLPPPPPPERPDVPQPAQQVTHYTTVPVPTPIPSPFPVPPAPPAPTPDYSSLASNEDVRGIPERPPAPPSAVPPPAPPVRIDARMIAGDLQPPYPASEQRLEHEGSVVIRVTVGADGRVVATEKVRATSDAFYEATARHARARWRFRPATVDGRPVQATKVLTVNFRLDEA